MVPPAEWLTTVTVRGRVTTKSGFMKGVIWFVPDQATLRHGGKDYATIGCWRTLDAHGGFIVELTRCDIPGQEFDYDIYLGEGHWRMQAIPREDGEPCEMSDLIEQANEAS